METIHTYEHTWNNISLQINDKHTLRKIYTNNNTKIITIITITKIIITTIIIIIMIIIIKIIMKIITIITTIKTIMITIIITIIIIKITIIIIIIKIIIQIKNKKYKNNTISYRRQPNLEGSYKGKKKKR